MAFDKGVIVAVWIHLRLLKYRINLLLPQIILVLSLVLLLLVGISLSRSARWVFEDIPLSHSVWSNQFVCAASLMIEFFFVVRESWVLRKSLLSWGPRYRHYSTRMRCFSEFRYVFTLGIIYLVLVALRGKTDLILPLINERVDWDNILLPLVKYVACILAVVLISLVKNLKSFYLLLCLLTFACLFVSV